MSNSTLFPVRAHALACELNKIKRLVIERNLDCQSIKLPGYPKDNLMRMGLSSPTVAMEIKCHFKLKCCRVRLSYREDESGINIPNLEVYSVEGELIWSNPVDRLDEKLATAVCFEIMHVLLMSKDIDINLY